MKAYKGSGNTAPLISCTSSIYDIKLITSRKTVFKGEIFMVLACNLTTMYNHNSNNSDLSWMMKNCLPQGS